MEMMFLVLLVTSQSGATSVVMPQAYPKEQCKEAARSLLLMDEVKPFCVQAPLKKCVTTTTTVGGRTGVVSDCDIEIRSYGK